MVLKEPNTDTVGLFSDHVSMEDITLSKRNPRNLDAKIKSEKKKDQKWTSTHILGQVETIVADRKKERSGGVLTYTGSVEGL